MSGLERKGDYGTIPLGKICDKCNLDSPNIVIEPVCGSHSQLWEIFYCVDCEVKGFVNVSAHHHTLSIFKWNKDVPVAIHWLREWKGLDA